MNLRHVVLTLMLVLQAASAFGDCIKTSKLILDAAEEGQKRLVLSRGAAFLTSVECLKDSTYPPTGLVESEWNGWWLLHSPDEDSGAIFALIGSNIALIMKTAKPYKEGKSWGAWGADVRAWAEMTNYVCDLRIEVPAEVKLGFAGDWPDTYPEGDTLCLSIAALAGANGYRLVQERGHILVEQALTSH